VLDGACIAQIHCEGEQGGLHSANAHHYAVCLLLGKEPKGFHVVGSPEKFGVVANVSHAQITLAWGLY